MIDHAFKDVLALCLRQNIIPQNASQLGRRSFLSSFVPVYNLLPATLGLSFLVKMTDKRIYPQLETLTTAENLMSLRKRIEESIAHSGEVDGPYKRDI